MTETEIIKILQSIYLNINEETALGIATRMIKVYHYDNKIGLDMLERLKEDKVGLHYMLNN